MKIRPAILRLLECKMLHEARARVDAARVGRICEIEKRRTCECRSPLVLVVGGGRECLLINHNLCAQELAD